MSKTYENVIWSSLYIYINNRISRSRLFNIKISQGLGTIGRSIVNVHARPGKRKSTRIFGASFFLAWEGN